MPMKFRFSWMPFVAAATAAAIGISLGNWQTRRAVEKETIEATLSAREASSPIAIGATPLAIDDVEYRRVQIKGEFLPDWTVYLDNRPYKGVAGFYVLTPMRVAGSGMHVLIARGWFKRDAADRARVPVISPPRGTVTVEGIARRNVGHVMQLGNAEPLRPGAIVQNAEVTGFAQAANLQMQPFVVEQLTDSQDGLVRDWPRPATGVAKHRGYAFQWYALAATAILFFVVTGFRRGTKQATE